jgi:hypothetical protein
MHFMACVMMDPARTRSGIKGRKGNEGSYPAALPEPIIIDIDSWSGVGDKRERPGNRDNKRRDKGGGRINRGEFQNPRRIGRREKKG